LWRKIERSDFMRLRPGFTAVLRINQPRMHIETVEFGLLRRICRPLMVHTIDITLRVSFVFRSSNIRIMIADPMASRDELDQFSRGGGLHWGIRSVGGGRRQMVIVQRRGFPKRI